MKKFIAILCCLITLFSTTAHAALPSDDDTIVSSMWDNIRNMTTTITKSSDTTAIANGIARKQTSASSIEGTLTVYEFKNGAWMFVTESHKSVTSGSLSISIEFAAQSGVKYKSVFDVIAYNGTEPEYASCEYEKTI